LIARLLVDGRQHMLICEYKSNGQPRYARSALLETAELRGAASPAGNAHLHRALPLTRSEAVVRREGRRLSRPEGTPESPSAACSSSVWWWTARGRTTRTQVAVQAEVGPGSTAPCCASPTVHGASPSCRQSPGSAWGTSAMVRTGLIDREWARASDDGLVLSRAGRTARRMARQLHRTAR
jgi:hypothetical protein